MYGEMLALEMDNASRVLSPQISPDKDVGFCVEMTGTQRQIPAQGGKHTEEDAICFPGATTETDA